MIEFDFAKTLQGIEGEFQLRVSGRIGEAQRVSFFGASGAGKSTILKILSGLVKPDKGSIVVDGEVWNDKSIFLPPQKRNLGFVFQDYALFPHLNVIENICFGKNASRDYAYELLEMMELHHIARHKIHQLSGGQAQRVALARALASKPKLLLLDEPLSALDFRIKNKIIDEINLLQKELKFVMILVSHHVSEIYRLSDQIFEIEQGRILSIKSPKESFSKNDIVLNVEVLDLKVLSLYARVDVLLEGEIFSFVCHPLEVQGVKIGERIKIVLKSFSPLILKA